MHPHHREEGSGYRFHRSVQAPLFGSGEADPFHIAGEGDDRPDEDDRPHAHGYLQIDPYRHLPGLKEEIQHDPADEHPPAGHREGAVAF